MTFTALPRNTQQSRAAFTLLEMLAALVLCGLLVLGIGRVLRSAVFQNNQARDEFRNQPALRRLTEQLRRDITNARGAALRRSSLVLDGFNGTDRMTRLPVLEPAIVTWRTTRIGTVYWLVRDEQRTNMASTEGISSDTIFAGVRRIVAESISGDSDTPQSRHGFPGVPLQLRVLLFADDDSVILDHVFQSHLE